MTGVQTCALPILAQARYAGGLTGQSDAIRAQLEQTAIRADLIALEGEKQQLKARLNGLLARDGTASLAEPDGLKPLPMLTTADALSLAERARERNPQILAILYEAGYVEELDPNDYALADRVRGLIGGSTENLCGQTRILELCAWIEHAQLVICNDSAPGHIAAAYGTPSLVITGGGHWQRCYPYDEGEAPIRSRPLAVSNPMPCFGCNWLCLYSLRDRLPFPCISAVTVEAAWQQLQRHLPWLATEEPMLDVL